MAMIGELRKVLKRLHYPLEVRLVCARQDGRVKKPRSSEPRERR